MTSADSVGGRRARPLSPHLSIYRPIVTMVMSIMHRVTGVMNVGGLLLVIAFLVGTASGPAGFEFVSGIYGSWLARIVLVTFTWSLIHHMLGGVRHALWDTGHGLDESRYGLAWATLIGSVGLTIVLWIVIMIVEAA